MKKKKSKTEIAFEWFAISLLFVGVSSVIYSLLHGGLL